VACHHSGNVIVTATLSAELTRRIGAGPAAFWNRWNWRLAPGKAARGLIAGQHRAEHLASLGQAVQHGADGESVRSQRRIVELVPIRFARTPGPGVHRSGGGRGRGLSGGRRALSARDAAHCRQAHADDHLDGIGSRPWDARRRLHGITPQTKQPLVHPVFFGSAITGTGVDALMAEARRLGTARPQQMMRTSP
jgi:hypothetical protein